MRGILPIVLVGVFVPAVGAQTSPLLDILSQELNRNFAVLKKADPPAYYIAYAVTENESESVSATLGALHRRSSQHSRALDITVRVGSPKLDNYHRIRGERANFTAAVQISLDDVPEAIQQRAWSETDRIYRLAAERLIKIKTNTQMKAAEEDASDDFSEAAAVTFVDRRQPLKFAPAEWTARVRKLSAEFANFRYVLTSSVSVMAQRQTKYFVNTEGARIEQGRGFARVNVSAQAKHADGMDLGTFDSFDAEDASRLPKDDAILAAVRRVAADLNGLMEAPVMEPFAGPAILSGSAAGVFFHEIFGHRVEGHRQKDEAEGQTFTKQVGKEVLPEFLSVVFDPTVRALDGTDLNGAYAYDDEGVKGQRIVAVDHGILKTFLMSRSPIQGFAQSNGHGRRQAGSEVVSRQSNLIVESAKQVPEAKLREMLVEEIRRSNKPYGLYFKRVTGGFTTTARTALQAFTVIPILVYRVFPDGRPDQLVRGADIVGTPLASFARIVATSDKREVFNGYCGAESGTVPVSAIAPALLVSEIEVQKKDHSWDRPPLLPNPTGGTQ